MIHNDDVSSPVTVSRIQENYMSVHVQVSRFYNIYFKEGIQ